MFSSKYNSVLADNNTNYIDKDIDVRGSNDFETSVNKSYNSVLSSSTHATSISGSASSSKAVLAALRALQDKIRRLETERSQAIDETTYLKQQLRTLEIENDQIRQKENLNAQKNIQEARLTYDKLNNEKIELELKLSKQEDKNKELQLYLDQIQLKIRSLEDEKHSGLLKIKELEAEKNQIENQVNYAQKHEKDLAQTMIWETKRHESEINNLTKRLKESQNELLNQQKDNHQYDIKIKDLDKLVSQLLTLNESLVEQLSGKFSRKTFNPIVDTMNPTNTSNPKPKVKSKKTSVPRVANKLHKKGEQLRSLKSPIKS
eukprot:gene19990-25960_t